MRTFFNILSAFLGGLVITLIFSAIAPGIGTIIGILLMVAAIGGAANSEKQRAAQIDHDLAMDRLGLPRLYDVAPRPRPEIRRPPPPPVNERGLTNAQELNP